MGLGPPVCEKCHVLADPLPKKDPRYSKATYYCKKCDSIDIKNSLWQYDLEDQILITATEEDK